MAWAGGIYFEKGYFPVKIDEEDKTFASLLLDIKTHPEKFKKELLETIARDSERKLIESYDTRGQTTFFDDELANWLCLKLYYPLIEKAKKEVKYIYG